MSASLTIFIVSFVFICFFVYAKARVLKNGKVMIFPNIGPSADRSIENLVLSLKSIFIHIGLEIEHFFEGFVKRKIALFFHAILDTIGRLLTFSHLRYKKYTEKRGAVSFFLKDVANHKNDLRKKSKGVRKSL